MDWRLLAVVCLTFGLSLGSGTSTAQSLLIDLGPGTAYAVNDNGQVVLTSGVYSGGTVTPFPATFTGTAINSTGALAGFITDSEGGTSAAVYSGGTITNIGALLPDMESPGLEFGQSTAINSGGQVAGWAVNEEGTGTFFAFIYTNPTAKVLPNFAGSVVSPAQAFGINDGGQVVGNMFNSAGLPGSSDAFIYDNNTGAMNDIGPGTAYAINSSGQVVGSNSGQAAGSNKPGGFLYANGTMAPLPFAGMAINATGQIVGGKFFYSGAITDLNDLVSATDPLKPFVTLSDARGINSSRQIVVNGTDSRTQVQHAYLLQGPWLDFAPGSLSFQSQAISTVSSAQSVSLINSGPTQLTIDSISTSGDFTQTNSCSASLAPSGSCAVMVSFAPTQAGDLSAVLTVLSGGAPANLSLTGVAPIKISISSSAATAIVGVPVTLTWTASPGASCTATGGSAADTWTGTVAVSGTQRVTESSAGAYQYGLNCTAGSQSATGQVAVAISWPSVTASISASPTTIAAGQSTTLTWKSSNANTCVATGGGVGDNWPGTKSTSGSATVTEAYVPATSVALTFSLKCTSAASGLSVSANAVVTENAPPPNKSGGGALDGLSLLFLTSITALSGFWGPLNIALWRRRRRRPVSTTRSVVDTCTPNS